MKVAKKMLLLASMALGAIAFAVPASASAEGATHWTHNDVVVSEGSDYEAPFEGRLQFAITVSGIPSSYSCVVTAKVTVSGPTTADISSFVPTTNTCEGTGVFTGCQLKNTHNNNAPWGIENGDTYLHVYPTSGEDITFYDEYENCAFGAIPPRHSLFREVTLDPTSDAQGTIEHLHVSGEMTAGAVHSGSLTPEGEKTLGLVTVP